jgi:hypothetical protein
VIMVAAVLIWGAILLSLAQSRSIPPIMICNVLGLPIMGISFWVTSVAKWQFVNPRARLLPGFAAPHLAIIMAWFFVGYGLIPLVTGVFSPGIAALPALAYGVLCGSMFVWAMHTGRPFPMFLGLAAYFSPAIPSLGAFWSGGTPILLLIQISLIIVGLIALGAWLRELSRLTEDSEAYIIPTTAQSGSASRMEKSEARRNLATQISRSWLTTRVIDWWVDPLKARRARSVRERQKLLRFGQSGTPAWLRSLWILAIMIAVIGFNYLFTRQSVSSVPIIVPTALVFSFVAPSITAQLLAMQRPRMSTELLWPLTRREYIDGLFRNVARDTIVFWCIIIGIVLVLVAVLDAEYLWLDWAPAALVGTFAGLTVTYGVSMFAALIESGITRTLLLLLGFYAQMGLLAMAGLAYVYVGAVVGYAILVLVGCTGVVIIRHSHARWMRAELG